ncbi:3-oxoadipate enol-lactonase [Dictyobacter alpinus]|uniref:3-oxoadipate enol-lactonase n=1 Tax=Dictyobacter alpinus TaxID=2014873 RepID=A0A402BIE0_9CHLR|nr:alpha/beta hydrolase [Dictyobacter alpinus]GCE31164.1 3-oxoadipate enol-lactonase [Dictyobacter alpinus]
MNNNEHSNPSERKHSAHISDFFNIDNNQIFYEIAGEGYPVVLAPQELPLDCGIWDTQFSFFAQHYRTLRYDLRGSGRSLSSDTNTTYYSDVNDLISLLDHLNCSSACIITSKTKFAFDLIYNHPERIHALVLTSPEIQTLGSALLSFPRTISYTREMLSILTALRQNDDYAVGQLFLKKWNIDSSSLSLETYQWLLNMTIKNIPTFSANVGVQKANVRGLINLKSILPNIKVPILMLIGTNAPVGISKTANTLQKLLPYTQKAYIPYSHVLLNIENPTTFNQSTLLFLQKTLAA